MELLDRFDKQIEVLLKNYDRLKKDNTVLRAKQTTLLDDCEAFKHKHDLVVSALEKIIKRLQKFTDDDSTP